MSRDGLSADTWTTPTPFDADFDILLDHIRDCNPRHYPAVLAVLDELERTVRANLYDPRHADTRSSDYLSTREAFLRTVPRPATDWLLRVLSKPPSRDVGRNDDHSDDEEGDFETKLGNLLDRASAVMALMCGRAALGAIVQEWEMRRREITLRIKEPGLAEGDIGFKTWGAARAMTRLLDEGAIPVEGRYVLELGSGTGLAGIAAAACGAAKVYLTDYSPACLRSCRENVESNAQCFPRGEDAVEVFGLDWTKIPEDDRGTSRYSDQATQGMLAPATTAPSGTRTLVESEKEEEQGKEEWDVTASTIRACDAGMRYDVIIGADLLYDPEHPHLVARVVARLLPRTERSAFYIAVPLRERYEREVIEINEAMKAVGLELKARQMVEGREEDTSMNYRVDTWSWP